MSHHSRTQQIFATAVLVTVADQLTKAVAGALRAGAILPVHNPDYSLGLVSGATPVLVLGSLVGLVAFGAHVVRRSAHGLLAPWVCGLLIGGALSNLADRVVLGAVRDFLATPWIVFNLADMAVLVGIGAYLLARLRPPVAAFAGGGD
ncbi:MAG: signal peptidase II [Actinobacteria bacterium]|nr:MAG: signal peptidase II [Actinomycetota bacterium]